MHDQAVKKNYDDKKEEKEHEGNNGEGKDDVKYSVSLPEQFPLLLFEPQQFWVHPAGFGAGPVIHGRRTTWACQRP